MKQITYLVVIYLLIACNGEEQHQEMKQAQWNQKKVTAPLSANLITGKTYLSVYSQIYSGREHITHNLTATVSMRNISTSDTIYITDASYYDTHGGLVRNYLETPIFLVPMETADIVIEETDKEGGTGGNFVFTWKVAADTPEPLFESVMISTSGQQGLSFSVQGKRIE